jgi:hypothetical protein
LRNTNPLTQCYIPEDLNPYDFSLIISLLMFGEGREAEWSSIYVVFELGALLHSCMVTLCPYITMDGCYFTQPFPLTAKLR